MIRDRTTMYVSNLQMSITAAHHEVGEVYARTSVSVSDLIQLFGHWRY